MADQVETPTTTDMGDIRGAMTGAMTSLLKTPTEADPKLVKAIEDEKEAGLKKIEAQKAFDVAKRGEMMGVKERGEADIAALQRQLGQGFKPTPETQGQLVSLFGMLGAVGAMGGTGGYTSALNAMNAMGGMLKGYNEGRADLFQREKQIYEKNRQALKDQLEFTNKSIERNMKYINEGLTAVTSRVAAEAQAKGYDFLAAQLKTQGLQKTQQLQQAATDRYIKATESVGSIFDKMQKTFGYAEGIGVGSQLARIYGPAAVANLDNKQKQTIYGSLSSVNNTMNLIKKAQDPEIKFGEASRSYENFYNLVRRNISGMNDNSSSETAAATIDKSAADAGLNPNDKNIVFYKEAIFTALEMERQARGGSILPVAVMKTLTPLLDPRTTTREAYIEILRRRANDVASQSGLTADQFAYGLRKMPQIQLSVPTVQPSAVPGGGGVPPGVTTSGW